jgi:hypothetical protein
VSTSEHPGRRQLTRDDLPAELTAESLRGIDFRTLRRLAHHGNGILDDDKQKQFDAAFGEVVRGTATLVNESLQRSRRGGPGNLDPALRRSYERTQQRLAAQAARARERYPELAEHLDPPTTSEPAEPDVSTTAAETPDDDVSPDTLEQEVEQTSDTLDLLEKIASIQEQQLEHQESQLLGETRGLFFAFVVSVAVIIAGVAPLVEAEPHDRLLIALWTIAVVAVAGLVYALVRAVQVKK